jgi:hypothetical protein
MKPCMDFILNLPFMGLALWKHLPIIEQLISQLSALSPRGFLLVRLTVMLGDELVAP